MNKTYSLVFLSGAQLQSLGYVIGAKIISEIETDSILKDPDETEIFFLEKSFIESGFNKTGLFLKQYSHLKTNPDYLPLYNAAVTINGILSSANENVQSMHPMDPEIRSSLVPYHFKFY
jgi:hypothetical protein